MIVKPRVLLFVDWFCPGFRAGGPIQSCLNLVRNLKNYIDFSIITSDRDLGMEIAYEGILPDQWQMTPEGIRVFYASPGFGYKSLKEIVKEETFSIMSLNSMYSRRFTQWPLNIALGDKNRNYEIILSPRGMLANGALSLKPLKKRIYLNAFRLLGIHRKLIWHATSDQEKKDIKVEFGRGVRVFLVPNLPALGSLHPLRVKKNKAAANFISVARISPVKNTLGVINAFSNVNGEINLSFLGPVEDSAYFEACKKACTSLPQNVHVEWLRERPSNEIERILASYHFFISATLGENFGHAIFEALSAGKPVIISDRTQWKDLSTKSIGFDISLENEWDWKKTVQICVDMDEEEYRKWSDSAASFSFLFRNNSELIEKNLNLFGAK